VKRRKKPRLSLATAEVVVARCDGWCECGCGCGLRATQHHHVFSQSLFPELADEADNVIALAARCHDLHTLAVRRLPRSVCARAERLAITPRMENYLDRNYRRDPE
jgi:hypothetical protein